jgi:hypothetical protein
MSEQMYKVEAIYGRVELETREVSDGNRILMQGRGRHLDLLGNLVEETPWVTNFVVYPDGLPQPRKPQSRPWWRFW